MGNSHYWTSLWVLVLFICLGLFCLLAVGAVIGFFSERLSILSLWHSPLWIRHKTPIIVVSVIIFVIALIAFIRYEGRREAQVAQEYAERQGWSFSQVAPQDIVVRVREIVPDLVINLSYARTVETGSRRIWLFNCQYKNKSASGRKSYDYGIACLIQSSRFHPSEAPLTIALRDWTEVMSSDKVDMGESPFAEKFIVLSQDAAAARKIVKESLQAVMLQYLADENTGWMTVTLGNRGAVLLTGRFAKQEELQDLLKWACRIEEAVN